MNSCNGPPVPLKCIWGGNLVLAVLSTAAFLFLKDFSFALAEQKHKDNVLSLSSGFVFTSFFSLPHSAFALDYPSFYATVRKYSEHNATLQNSLSFLMKGHIVSLVVHFVSLWSIISPSLHARKSRIWLLDFNFFQVGSQICCRLLHESLSVLANITVVYNSEVR